MRMKTKPASVCVWFKHRRGYGDFCCGPNGLTVSGAECIADRAPPFIYPFPRQVPGLCCCVSSPLTFLLPYPPLLPKIDTGAKNRARALCYGVLSGVDEVRGLLHSPALLWNCAEPRSSSSVLKLIRQRRY